VDRFDGTDFEQNEHIDILALYIATSAIGDAEKLISRFPDFVPEETTVDLVIKDKQGKSFGLIANVLTTKSLRALRGEIELELEEEVPPHFTFINAGGAVVQAGLEPKEIVQMCIQTLDGISCIVIEGVSAVLANQVRIVCKRTKEVVIAIPIPDTSITLEDLLQNIDNERDDPEQKLKFYDANGNPVAIRQRAYRSAKDCILLEGGTSTILVDYM